jgi:glycosyltransferase involved in cell wall biosynthesis
MTQRVFILTSQSPQLAGGLEHFVRELQKGLNARGYRVETFHQGNSMPAWLRSPAGAVEAKVSASLLGYFVSREARKRMGPDVRAVISNGDVRFNPAGEFFPGLKQIHFFHGTYRAQADAIRPSISWPGYLYLKWWASMRLERLSGKGKLVLCNSDQTREEVQRFFGYDAATAWLPLDTGHFRPLDNAACRAELQVPAEEPVGIFVGSAHPMKGMTVLRELIASFAKIRWVLALRGEIPTDLRAAPNVTLLRDASPSQLPALYNAADFAVAPSRYEPFGYVVAEALACGTPVIASPGGASRQFLCGEPFQRLLVSGPDAAEEFRAAIKLVLSRPEEFRRLVVERLRPQVVEIMSPPAWWTRFLELTGL